MPRWTSYRAQNANTVCNNSDFDTLAPLHVASRLTASCMGRKLASRYTRHRKVPPGHHNMQNECQRLSVRVSFFGHYHLGRTCVPLVPTFTLKPWYGKPDFDDMSLPDIFIHPSMELMPVDRWMCSAAQMVIGREISFRPDSPMMRHASPQVYNAQERSVGLANLQT